MTIPLKTRLARLSLLLALAGGVPHVPVSAAEPSPVPTGPGNRIASVALSQDFINEQLRLHAKSDMVSDLKLTLDSERDRLLIRGLLQVPLEELRAVNLDPKQGRFRFQLSAKLSVTKKGHLIIEFPLNETFFYPSDSKEPEKDRVVIPTQMLSIALASARGYLAAIAGDFGGFDRRTAKLQALLKATERSMVGEKNPDALDDLRTQRDSLRIQLAAIPIERKQLQSVAKEYSSLFGFTGEKEINLNDELAAKKNAIALKIRLSQLLPYLDGVDLGGARIHRDKKDGNGENYFSIDINAQLAVAPPPPSPHEPSDRPPMKTAPALVVRLKQALFESEALADMEKKEAGSKIEDLKMDLMDDGLHVSGKTHVLLVPVSFETIVDFVSTGLDVFEVRVREIKVAGMDFDFLAKFILKTIKRRLNTALRGICKFKYVGQEDHAHALRVMVSPKALVPAFPDLHLVNVDVRPGEFLLKIGRQ